MSARGSVGYRRVGAGAPLNSPVSGPIEHGLIGWTYDPSYIQGGTVVPTAGRLELVRIKVLQPVVTAIRMRVTVAGSSLTAGRCFAAVFTEGGGLLGAGAVTADMSGVWNSTGPKDMPIVGAQLVVPNSYYLVGFFFNGTTGPTFERAASTATINDNISVAPFRYSTADTGLTTTMPSNVATQSAATVAWWVGLR